MVCPQLELSLRHERDVAATDDEDDVDKGDGGDGRRRQRRRRRHARAARFSSPPRVVCVRQRAKCAALGDGLESGGGGGLFAVPPMRVIEDGAMVALEPGDGVRLKTPFCALCLSTAHE